MKQRNGKLWMTMLLAAALLLSMAGCQLAASSGETDNGMTLQPGQSDTELEGLTLQLVDSVWADGELILTMDWVNATGQDAAYGSQYSIERYENGQWVSCAKEGDYVFTALAYPLDAGKTNRESYTVSAAFDVSQPGAYRFTTACYIPAEEGASEEIALWVEFSLSAEADTEIGVAVGPVDFGVQYIRTDGYVDGAEFPRLAIIRSVEELNDYYASNRETFDLERKDTVYSDTTIGFLDACDKYDAAYFEENYLIFVLLEAGSGSIHYDVQCLTAFADGSLSVYIRTEVPEVGTCDMAEWHLMLELGNNVNVPDEAGVRIYMDSTLVYGEAISTTGEIKIALYQPPEARLHHSNGTDTIVTGGYSWVTTDEDGLMNATVADAAHPLDCRDLLEPIYVSGDTAALELIDGTYFVTESCRPDSVTVRCWPDTQWGNTDAESETVSCDYPVFAVKPGGYIYEITAVWNDSANTHSGTVCYYAYLYRDGQ